MDILISSNDRYVMPLTVLLQSIFNNCKRPIRFFFLAGDICDKNCRFLRDFALRNNAEMVFIPVGKTEFMELPTKKYISRETYFRLLAADSLPDDLHKILWLDADMIVNGDISDLFDMEMGNMAVAACPHGSVMQQVIQENCKDIGIEIPGQYFNAGMMLCNLDVWRNMNIREKIQDILCAPHTFRFPGQDLTNLVFNGRVLTLNWEEYNCMTHSVLKKMMPSLREKARIIHFVGAAKPWQFYDLPFVEDWMKYYDQSPFYGQKLKQTSYFRMRALYERLNKYAD